MPTYAYRCKECGHQVDILQKITAEPIKTCPECNRDSLRRIPTGGAGVHFKGEGFYETDYKGKPGP